jgi:hypothetical protein
LTGPEIWTTAIPLKTNLPSAQTKKNQIFASKVSGVTNVVDDNRHGYRMINITDDEKFEVRHQNFRVS